MIELTAAPPVQVLRYSAFATDPALGNPAGVVLEAEHLSAEDMLAIAAEVGYSETAFVTGPITDGSFPLRYFSPLDEVTFCGHATVATTAALAEHVAPGEYVAQTAAGPVAVQASLTSKGPRGSFTSPPTSAENLPEVQLDELLASLGWQRSDLAPDWIPGIGVCGNRHPVLVAASVEQLSRFDYDFDRLQQACRDYGWQTIQMVAQVDGSTWRSRNPFPIGGVVEDPATGSAAGAFAGYLHSLGRAAEGSELTLDQGVEMGRHSRIEVEVLDGRAHVAGTCATLGLSDAPDESRRSEQSDSLVVR